MYKKVNADLNFVSREQEILKLWQEMDLKSKLKNLNRNKGKHFTLFDGPPTANGKPHIGHVLTRVIKDIIPRYKRMKGHFVEFKAGWDTHGLPVELEVEKYLGINGKPAIEEYGIEPFIQQCKESVWKYKDQWETISERIAYCADMENPYVTYHNNYIESEWWAIKEIDKKGLLYKGHKIVPYCPRCGTALASHEVAQGYKDVSENTAYVRFKVKDAENTWFIAWTTTPWTLPSNLALCVSPDSSYALVEVSFAKEEKSHLNGKYYLAESLVEKVFGNEAKIIELVKGKELEYKKYEPLLPYAVQQVEESKQAAFFVTCDDYVTLSDGTGIVHIAPAFGDDDARVGRNYQLPFVQLVKENGTLPEEVTDFAGVFCKEADKGIIKLLNQRGLLVKTELHTHSYPFCWRCDTPLIYYARHSWYIEMSKLREQMVKNNQKVNWIPENIGEGRFGNFIANAVDWALSRERYWGTPLPVWLCQDCGHRHVVGSIAELRSLAKHEVKEDIELHRPFIDEIELKCQSCSGTMKRTPEVIDCWFDSGAMPFAQYHYPFENKELFEKNFPSEFISEALDQTRGWFYSLMALGTLLFDQNPYENVIVLGLVQDKNGQKMSKHKGNVTDPWDVLNAQGADATRWYFYTNSNPWLPSRFSQESVFEGQRRFMGTLWNVYAFYIMYAKLDEFDPQKYPFTYETLSSMDKWILSRLQTLIKTVDEGLTRYDITFSARAIHDFVDILSNWYVRRGRGRYWGKEMTSDKIAAYQTLYKVLEQLVSLIAPFVPFLSESIYQNLILSSQKDAPESVHLTSFPEVNEAWILPEIEQEMNDLLTLVGLARACRNEANIKNRQPLAKMSIACPRKLPARLEKELLEELNIREIAYLDADQAILNYKFKPQLRILGKKYGSLLNEIKDALLKVDGAKTYKELKENKQIVLKLQAKEIVLTEEEVLIELLQPEGLACQQYNDFTVALDLTITKDLLLEGYMRELVSKIQTMRKEAQYEVEDRIEVSYLGDTLLSEVFAKYMEELKTETLATQITDIAYNHPAYKLAEESTEDEANQKMQEFLANNFVQDNSLTNHYVKTWSINGLPCALLIVKNQK